MKTVFEDWLGLIGIVTAFIIALVNFGFAAAFMIFFASFGAYFGVVGYIERVIRPEL